MKANYRLIVFLFGLIALSLPAQDVAIDKLLHLGAGNYNSVHSVCIDDLGNTYIAGQFFDSVGIGDTTLYSTQSIYLSKFNNNDEIIWVRKMGNKSSRPKILLNSKAEIIMTAHIYSTIESQNGEVKLDGACILKINGDGDIIWVRDGFNNNNTLFAGTTIDSEDNILLTGSFSREISMNGMTINSYEYSNMFFIKIASSGEAIFLKEYGSRHAYEGGTAICTDKNNDIYLGLHFTGKSITIEDTVVVGTLVSNLPTTHDDNEMVLCKFNSIGELKWAHYFEGLGKDYIDGVRVNDALDIFIAGRYGQSIQIQDSLFYRTGKYNDVFCGKLNQDLELYWAKSFHDDDQNRYLQMIIDKRDNMYLAANFYKKSTVEDIVIDHNGGIGFYLSKLNTEGDVKWVVSPKCRELFDNNCLTLDEDDNIYIAGGFSGVFELDEKKIISYSEEQGFMARIPAYTCNAGEDLSMCLGDSVSLGGNPSSFNGAAPYAYKWFPNINLSSDTVPNPVSFAADSTVYLLTVTDADGHVLSDSITVFVDTIPPAHFSLGDDITACQYDTITLSPVPYPQRTYRWNTGSTNKTCEIWSEGIYTLEVSNGCGLQTDSISLFLNPTYALIVDTSFCENDSVLLGDTYYSEKGVYYDSLKTVLGCDSVFTYTVLIDSLNTEIELFDNRLISSANSVKYQWLDCNHEYSMVNGAIQKQFESLFAGRFSVEITNNACIDTSACYELIGEEVGYSNFSSIISIYPNPSSNHIYIDFLNKQQEVTITLRDMVGKVYDFSRFNETSTVSYYFNVPKGLYLLEIRNSEDELSIMKLLVH